MATNRKYDAGDQIALPVVAGVLSGEPVIVGQLPGVAMIDRDADGEATLQFDGVYNLSVAATAAMAVGDLVYITAATRVLSNTAAGNIRFGYLMQAIAGAGTVTVPVKVGY